MGRDNWIDDAQGAEWAQCGAREKMVKVRYSTGVLRAHVDTFADLVQRAVDGEDVSSELRTRYRYIVDHAARLGRISCAAIEVHRAVGSLRRLDVVAADER